MSDRFLRSDFSLIEDKRKIPKNFFKVQRKTAKSSFTIANKNEDYNFSDLIVKGIPTRQLIFAGVDSTNTFGFIFFNSGGIVISAKILIFDIKSKKNPKFLPLNLDDHPTTLEQLKLSVKKINFAEKGNGG
jgi:hypothetical protein